MSIISTNSIPKAYTYCTLKDCPLSSTCLRSLALPYAPSDVYRISIANPKRCTQNEKCPYYAENKPQRIALGFKSMQAKMVPAQYDRFMTILIERYGRHNYFKMRRGDKPISADNQEYIRSILAKIEAPENCDFDAYEEQIVW